MSQQSTSRILGLLRICGNHAGKHVAQPFRRNYHVFALLAGKAHDISEEVEELQGLFDCIRVRKSSSPCLLIPFLATYRQRRVLLFPQLP
eukprot:scaffold26_cov173-Pinguiococcus_pyrenoidosus.AAC.8